MRYPSCYVLVTDLDESTTELHKNPNTQPTTQQISCNIIFNVVEKARIVLTVILCYSFN